jgi:hypothetical protein
MSTMSFDQMLETWRADGNRGALRQALQTEEARFRRELRVQRWPLWFCGIFGTGMAIWAGLWITVVISNGWPAFYAKAAGVCFGMFAFSASALWASRGRQVEPERNSGSTLEEELKRSLALVDYQLSVNSRAIVFILGTVSLLVGTMFFSWTIMTSQDIPDPSFDGWFPFLLVVFCTWIFFKAWEEMRKAKLKLELRQQRLRELLAVLDAR